MLLKLGCLLLTFGSILCHHNFKFVKKFKCWYRVLDGVQDYAIVFAVFGGCVPHCFILSVNFVKLRPMIKKLKIS